MSNKYPTSVSEAIEILWKNYEKTDIIDPIITFKFGEVEFNLPVKSGLSKEAFKFSVESLVRDSLEQK